MQNIIYLLLPLANLVFFGLYYADEVVFSQIPLTTYGTAALAAVCEELFFRGILLHHAVFSFRMHPLWAAGMVSCLFGILHIVNCFSYATWDYVMIQVLCAIAAGMLLADIYLERGIIACVLWHITINITGALHYSGNSQPDYHLNVYMLSGYTLIAVWYLWCGVQRLKRQQNTIAEKEFK